MALPTTIDGTNVLLTTTPPLYAGPFISSAGNVYVVVFGSGGGVPRVYKATDPTSSFAEQNSAGRPTGDVRNALWVLQDSDTLRIYQSISLYHDFSMSTDTWGLKQKATGVGLTSPASFIKRSDGSLILLGAVTSETLMGVGRARVSYTKSTDSGATWGTPVAVGATGVKRDIYGGIAILGDSDRTHLFYSDTTANAKHRSLSSADALDTEAAVLSPATPSQTNFKPGVSYVSGANTVVKVPVNASGTADKLTGVRFNSSANPTIATDATFTDATAKVNEACYALDGTTVHALWADNSNNDVMHDSQTDGGAFGTDVNELAATIGAISCNIYTRSGSKVLAYLYDDNGTVKYNEIVLSAASGTPAARRFGQVLFTRPVEIGRSGVRIF